MKLYIDTGIIDIYLSYGHDIPPDAIHIDDLYAACDATYHVDMNDGRRIEIHFIYDNSTPMIHLLEGDNKVTMICVPTRLFSIFNENIVDEIFSLLKTDPEYIVRSYTTYQRLNYSIDDTQKGLSITPPECDGFIEIPMGLCRLIHYVDEYQWIMRCIGPYHFCLTTLYGHSDFTYETVKLELNRIYDHGMPSLTDRIQNDIENGNRYLPIIDYSINRGGASNGTVLFFRFPFNVAELKQARILFFFDNFLSRYKEMPYTQLTITIGTSL